MEVFNLFSVLKSVRTVEEIGWLDGCHCLVGAKNILQGSDMVFFMYLVIFHSEKVILS